MKPLTQTEAIYLADTYRFPLDRTWRQLSPPQRASVRRAMTDHGHRSKNGPAGFLARLKTAHFGTPWPIKPHPQIYRPIPSELPIMTTTTLDDVKDLFK